jgi:hypothetical protein
MKVNHSFFCAAAVAVSLTLSVLTGWTQEQTQPVPEILKPVESLIDRNTFLVLYADVTAEAMDVEEWSKYWNGLLDSVIASAKTSSEIMEAVKNQGTDIDEMTETAKTYLKERHAQEKIYQEKLRSLGVTAMYVLSNSRIMMSIPVQLVVVGNADKMEELQELLQQKITENEQYNLSAPMLHFTVKENLLIMNAISPAALKDGQKNTESIERDLARIKPSIRPEFAAALANTDTSPVQLVFAPDGALWGFFSFGLALLPEPYNKIISYKTVKNGFQWISLTANPTEFTAKITIQSDSPEAAQVFADLSHSLQEMYLQKIEDDGVISKEAVDRIRELNGKAKPFLPKLVGSQFLLDIDIDYVKKYIDEVLIPSVESVLPLLSSLG